MTEGEEVTRSLVQEKEERADDEARKVGRRDCKGEVKGDKRRDNERTEKKN